MKRHFLLIVIVLIGISLSDISVWASGGFTVTPVFQEIVLTEEGVEEFVVSVTNETESIATFRLSVLDFGSLDETGGVAFRGAPTELEKKYALASWMRPATDTLTLLPGRSEEVKVIIENRQDLSPGGHYAAIIFTNTEGDGSDPANNRIAVNQIFSVLVFVKKQGGEVYGLELVDKSWSHHLLSFDDKVRLRFRNTGNVHLVPRGLVTLTDPIGRTIAEAIINEESSLILPETFRLFPVNFIPRERAWIPGRYRFSILWRYEGNTEFTLTEEVFDFIPLPAILSILPVLVGAGWYVAKKRKNTGDKASKSSTA